MSREILMLVDALAREKSVDKEVVFEALEQALASATKKRFKDDADVRVTINRDTGDYESFRRWQVVTETELESEGYQILLIDAQDTHADIELGDYIEEPLENIEFGRIVPRLPNRSFCKRSATPSANRSSATSSTARNILSTAW